MVLASPFVDYGCCWRYGPPILKWCVMGTEGFRLGRPSVGMRPRSSTIVLVL